ncbi:MAG: hypothetical protein AAF533_17695 [Acidobacteriota bacterium]
MSDKDLAELAPDVWSWSVWHEEKSLHFNGFLVLHPDGNVALDPPALNPTQLDQVWQLGGVSHVVLMNGHHGRQAPELVARTSARVHAPKADVSLLSFDADETYTGGDELPAGLLAIGFKAAKTKGEHALLLPRDGGTLFLGDSLLGRPEGALSMLPDEKFKEPDRARLSLRVLLDHAYERVLVADGHQPEGARAAIENFLVHQGLRPKGSRAH